LTELRDAFARPRAPRINWRRRLCGVRLEHGDVEAVAGEHHRGAQADAAAAANDDRAHTGLRCLRLEMRCGVADLRATCVLLDGSAGNCEANAGTSVITSGPQTMSLGDDRRPVLAEEIEQ
jgi:hypothetical protein